MNLRLRLALLYSVAFFASSGATLLTLGFFYFTRAVWGWNAKLNLSLAASMNVAYVVSSLSAHAISTRFGRRRALAILYAMMTACCAAASFAPTHLLVSSCLLVYMFFTGMTWPMLESLCSQTTDAHAMSRRVGAYNLTWAVAGAIAVWIAGVLIEHWESGMYLLPLILHGSTAVMMFVLLVPTEGASEASAEPHNPATHLEAEPLLLRSRTLALWLSRIALPAMYVVNYALGAILPSLPILKDYSPAKQTLIGSIWLVARMLSFAILGATAFWHTRPRLLLLSSAGLLIAFLIVTLAPSLSIMIAGQILLGVAMAMIYTGSLYFGMVLSSGSTEHSGYHEALIGLGGVLGPGAGALTQYFWPGEVRAAIAAVAGIVWFSVLAASVASMRLRPQSQSEAAVEPAR